MLTEASVTTLAASPNRRLTQRLPRVDTRLVVGLLLVALSVIGGLRLAATADHTVLVLSAARDLPADHVLVAGDMTTTRIQASDKVLDGLVRATAGTAPTDRVLRFPLTEGDLVAGAALGRVAREGREITVPIAPEHALGGALEPGDRVDVLGSFDKGTEAAKTLTVASGAQVVAVVHADGLFGQREGELAALTISVPPRDVVFVAFAIRNGELDVVRSVGKRPRAVRSRFDANDIP
jgi:Flp pilus assembly protein CpaB